MRIRVLASCIACIASIASTASAQMVSSGKTYGQELVDQTIAQHPELLVVAMHVSTPTLPGYPIVASNIGRYGKLADKDDLRVITTEKPNLETSPDQKRYEVQLVMRDVSGKNLGALGLVFKYRPGDDRAALEKTGIAIRDGLQRRVISAATLLEPHPLISSATTKTHAQKIVDAVYEAHKDLIVIAMHVDLPKDGGNVILASTFGRIGKKGDDDDLRVIRTGEVKSAVYAEGKRWGVAMPMYDVTGKTIGAVNFGYAFKAGDDESVLLAKATAIRDELKTLSTSAGDLAELDP